MKSSTKNDIKIGLFNHNNSWITKLAGHGESRHPLYILYIFFVLLLHVYLLIFAAWAVVLVVPDKILSVLAAHIIFAAIFCGYLVVSRFVTARSMREANRMILSGIFDYEDEEIDEHQSNMKKEIDEEIRKICDLVAFVFGSGAVWNVIVFPLTQLVFHDGSYEGTILNPYLPPFFFYIPFDTRTPIGYCLAYLIVAVSTTMLYSECITSLIMYIQSSLYLKGQLQILNYSMENLLSRAYSKFKKMEQKEEYSQEVLLQNEDFRNCVYSCFRDNVRHHQTLLRYRAYIQPFNGACLLDCYVVVALIYGSLFYMILQSPPLGFLINFIEMLLTEQSTVFLMCYTGERITEEHGRLFDTLYSLEWIGCSKKVTNGFRIMMSNTVKPLYIQALLLECPASLKSYGEVMMAMYKIVNLVRQSGLMQ